jgi:hypothetical protein
MPKKKTFFFKSFSKTSSAKISENRRYTINVTPMLPACSHRLDGIDQIGPWECSRGVNFKPKSRSTVIVSPQHFTLLTNVTLLFCA